MGPWALRWVFFLKQQCDISTVITPRAEALVAHSISRPDKRNSISNVLYSAPWFFLFLSLPTE